MPKIGATVLLFFWHDKHTDNTGCTMLPSQFFCCPLVIAATGSFILLMVLQDCQICGWQQSYTFFLLKNYLKAMHGKCSNFFGWMSKSVFIYCDVVV
jgi:hypothetical protein